MSWPNIYGHVSNIRGFLSKYMYLLQIYFLNKILFTYFQRGRARTRNINVWEKHQSVALARTQLGTRPTTQACALMGNWTRDLSVHKPAHNPLSHTSQGSNISFNNTQAITNLVSFVQVSNLTWQKIKKGKVVKK